MYVKKVESTADGKPPALGEISFRSFSATSYYAHASSNSSFALSGGRKWFPWRDAALIAHS